MSSSRDRKRFRSGADAVGFTFVELLVVITLIGVISSLLAQRLGTFQYWREESAVRKLSELCTFLYYQAVVDQAFYRLEINLTDGSYSVGVMKALEGQDDQLAAIAADVGALSLEMAAFLSPSLGRTQSIIPPPAFPSLAVPTLLPEGMRFEDVRTMRGKIFPSDNQRAFVLFSPRGFSEFSVFHLIGSRGQKVTILVNPFTGTTEIFREYKDFEWTYGRKREGANAS